MTRSSAQQLNYKPFMGCFGAYSTENTKQYGYMAFQDLNMYCVLSVFDRLREMQKQEILKDLAL